MLLTKARLRQSGLYPKSELVVAGCDAHVSRCVICDEAICDGCLDEHGCAVARKPPQPERGSRIDDEEWREQR